MWMRKKNLRRDSMAMTRSFALSSFRPAKQTSLHNRSPGQHASVIVRTGEGEGDYQQNNNHLHNLQRNSRQGHQGSGNDLRSMVTATSGGSDSSGGSDHSSGQRHHLTITPAPNKHKKKAPRSPTSARSGGDWLGKMKKRALVIFWRQKSGEGREGVIDTRYDCDGVPDIDADITFASNGSSDRMLLHPGAGGQRGGGGRDEGKGQEQKKKGGEENNVDRSGVDTAEDKNVVVVVVGNDTQTVPIHTVKANGSGNDSLSHSDFVTHGENVNILNLEQ
jgi:hypothetical protein